MLDIEFDGEITGFEPASIDGPEDYGFSEFETTFHIYFVDEGVRQYLTTLDESNLFDWLELNTGRSHPFSSRLLKIAILKLEEEFSEYLIEQNN